MVRWPFTRFAGRVATLPPTVGKIVFSPPATERRDPALILGTDAQKLRTVRERLAWWRAEFDAGRTPPDMFLVFLKDMEDALR